ncbi:MAG: YncE family protein [Sphingomonadales bacterium]|nr:YncE family protein [Sphingomonadales bacterium]
MNIARMMLAAAAVGLAPAPAQAEAPPAQVIPVPGFADFIAVDRDSVWLTNRTKVERWSRKGKLAEAAMSRACGAMTVYRGSLWVADCKDNVLVRIDTRTGRRLAAIPTGIGNRAGELNVVSGAGSVWIASDDAGTVARIDPSTNRVVATVKVDPGTWYLAFGYDSLWAVSARQQSLQRIDPRTNAVVHRTPLGKEPGFLAAGADGVWVQEQGDGTVARIDPASGELAGRVKVGEVLKYGDIDTGGGKVWMRTTEAQTFAVLNPKTMTVDARIGKAEGSGALRYTPKGVWTSAHDVHTITWWPKPDEISQ